MLVKYGWGSHSTLVKNNFSKLARNHSNRFLINLYVIFMDIQAITLFYLRQEHFENILDLNPGINHAIMFTIK